MFKIDLDQVTKVALSAVGALLLTTGAFAAAAGPAMVDAPATVTYADASAMDGASA